MKRAIYPGSFDPCTLGHLDIIKRASKMVDELVVGVLINKAKTPLFSTEYRVSMLKEVVRDLPNVKVESFEGLLADYARATKDTEILTEYVRHAMARQITQQVTSGNRIFDNKP